jgi:hypothetical protein
VTVCDQDVLFGVPGLYWGRLFLLQFLARDTIKIKESEDEPAAGQREPHGVDSQASSCVSLDCAHGGGGHCLM